MVKLECRARINSQRGFTSATADLRDKFKGCDRIFTETRIHFGVGRVDIVVSRLHPNVSDYETYQ